MSNPAARRKVRFEGSATDSKSHPSFVSTWVSWRSLFSMNKPLQSDFTLNPASFHPTESRVPELYSQYQPFSMQAARSQEFRKRRIGRADRR
jgi:hypothetical protein